MSLYKNSTCALALQACTDNLPSSFCQSASPSNYEPYTNNALLHGANSTTDEISCSLPRQSIVAFFQAADLFYQPCSDLPRSVKNRPPRLHTLFSNVRQRSTHGNPFTRTNRHPRHPRQMTLAITQTHAGINQTEAETYSFAPPLHKVVF